MFTSLHEHLPAEKMAGRGEDIVHGPPDVTDLCSSALSLNQEDQSDCMSSQMFNFSEADISDFFMEKEVNLVCNNSL